MIEHWAVGALVLSAALLVSAGVWEQTGPAALAPSVRGSTQDSSHALWQIEVSANCNNRVVCLGESFLGQPFTVGGLWGWMELNSSGGRAEFTACQGSSVPGSSPGDTVHVSVRITAWSIGAAGTFVIGAGSETVRGKASAGSVLPIVGPVDTGIRALPGHYTSFVGSRLPPYPGVRVDVQVVESQSS